jgi:hypothetical protein
MKGITHPPEKGIPVKHPMMHRTWTLDYAVILSGEIDMMLDDTSVHLKQGDVIIVQQATNPGWVLRVSPPTPEAPTLLTRIGGRNVPRVSIEVEYE